MSSAASTSATPTAGATKRLLRELANWRAEQRQHWQEMMTKREQRQQGGSDQVGGAGDENLRDVGGIERLGPVAEDQLLRWEAVINGRGLGGGYDEGRWLLILTLPSDYPLHPPTATFVTPIIHPNVDLRTGAICLDLFAEGWSPAYGVVESVRAIRHLLANPGIDSPLNVDVAALLRAGDAEGARSLVRWFCLEPGARFEGE